MTDLERELLAALIRLVASCEKLPAFTDPKNLLAQDRLNAARTLITAMKAEGRAS